MLLLPAERVALGSLEECLRVIAMSRNCYLEGWILDEGVDVNPPPPSRLPGKRVINCTQVVSVNRGVDISTSTCPPGCWMNCVFTTSNRLIRKQGYSFLLLPTCWWLLEWLVVFTSIMSVRNICQAGCVTIAPWLFKPEQRLQLFNMQVLWHGDTIDYHNHWNHTSGGFPSTLTSHYYVHMTAIHAYCYWNESHSH